LFIIIIIIIIIIIEKERVFSIGVKRLECEADHFFPHNDEVKNGWSITSITPTS